MTQGSAPSRGARTAYLVGAVFCFLIACALGVALVWPAPAALEAPPAAEPTPALYPHAPTEQATVEPTPTVHRETPTAQPTKQPTAEPAPAVHPEATIPQPDIQPAATPTVSPVPIGASIELHVLCSGQRCVQGPGLWTIVQWQDGLGAWHDVAGWQGWLDEGWRKAWWVEEKDLGTGPFRWALLCDCCCEAWAVSAPFDLPAEPGQVLRVVVVLGG